MGSDILTSTLAMNTIRGYATGSILSGVVGFIVLWILTLPRTLKKVSYLSFGCKLLHGNQRNDTDPWKRSCLAAALSS
jgi:hypothetical protein